MDVSVFLTPVFAVELESTNTEPAPVAMLSPTVVYRDIVPPAVGAAVHIVKVALSAPPLLAYSVELLLTVNKLLPIELWTSKSPPVIAVPSSLRIVRPPVPADDRTRTKGA